MELIEKAKKELENAEAGLRELLAEAAKAGDYGAVTTLTRWAKEIASLNGKAPEPARKESATGTKRSKEKSSKAGKRSSKRKGDYPKFYRRRDKLVRVGRSKKKGKKEYRQNVPKEVVMAVTEAIAKAAAEHDLFQAEDFMPVPDPRDGSELPNYHGYAVLKWLVKEGLVEKQGRQGYTTARPGTLLSDVEEHWKSLTRK